jgi:hypothetical protein
MESKAKVFFGFIFGSIALVALIFGLYGLHLANQARLLEAAPAKTVQQKNESLSAAQENEEEETESRPTDDGEQNEPLAKPVTSITLSPAPVSTKEFSFSTNGKSTEGYMLVWSRVDRTGYTEAQKKFSPGDPFWQFYDGKSRDGFTFGEAPEKGTVDVSKHLEYLKNGEYKLHICLVKNGLCSLRSNVIIYKFD